MPAIQTTDNQVIYENQVAGMIRQLRASAIDASSADWTTDRTNALAAWYGMNSDKRVMDEIARLQAVIARYPPGDERNNHIDLASVLQPIAGLQTSEEILASSTNVAAVNTANGMNSVNSSVNPTGTNVISSIMSEVSGFESIGTAGKVAVGVAGLLTVWLLIRGINRS